jgi:hypothetical protein
MLLYYFSPFLLFIRLALNGFCFQLVGKVSFVPFSKREISDLFRQSKVVIDITHPNQVGLTSRTFEALRSGSKLATNNVHCRILEADFPSRVFLLDRDSLRGPALMNFIESDVAPLSDEQDRFLSVGRFADQLLEILND